ncbi:MAG: hypothetical protein DHS20C13_22660 [Thermodesulfobacteriota bacterium]|nr:MAG: hypothetical protein DHS20C13_22660 [Thermodesulfobacteriota bacterium]
MNLSRNFLILIIFTLILSAPLSIKAKADENTDVKKELQELKQMMKQMQDRMEDLEERNQELEKQAKQKQAPVQEKTIIVEEEETDLTVIEPPVQQTQQGFLGKALNAFNPEISVIGTFAAAYYSQDEPFVFAENDPENTGVNVQEVEVGFQGVVDSFFRYDMFLSFSTEGVELEEAYGTTLFSLPLNSQFRVGRARAKFGRVNQLHRHAQNFVTLPLPAAQFLGEHLNPTSIEANFLVPVPWYLELSASGGSPDVETPTFARDEDANDLGRLLYIFHMSNFFELSEALGVTLGGSFATGSNGTAAGERSNLYGIDLYAKYRPLKNNPYQEFILQSEFMYLDAGTPEQNLENWGWYGQAVYRFAKRWDTGFRFGIIDTNTPVTEVEEGEDIEATNLFATIRNEEGEEEEGMLGLLGRTYRISPMVTFSPSEFSQIRLQYDYLNQDFAENQHAVFLQFQYAIGAHGAHPF